MLYRDYNDKFDHDFIQVGRLQKWKRGEQRGKWGKGEGEGKEGRRSGKEKKNTLRHKAG